MIYDVKYACSLYAYKQAKPEADVEAMARRKEAAGEVNASEALSVLNFLFTNPRGFAAVKPVANKGRKEFYAWWKNPKTQQTYNRFCLNFDALTGEAEAPRPEPKPEPETEAEPGTKPEPEAEPAKNLDALKNALKANTRRAKPEPEPAKTGAKKKGGEENTVIIDTPPTPPKPKKTRAKQAAHEPEKVQSLGAIQLHDGEINTQRIDFSVHGLRSDHAITGDAISCKACQTWFDNKLLIYKHTDSTQNRSVLLRFDNLKLYCTIQQGKDMQINRFYTRNKYMYIDDIRIDTSIIVENIRRGCTVRLFTYDTPQNGKRAIAEIHYCEKIVWCIFTPDTAKTALTKPYLLAPIRSDVYGRMFTAKDGDHLYLTNTAWFVRMPIQDYTNLVKDKPVNESPNIEQFRRYEAMKTGAKKFNKLTFDQLLDKIHLTVNQQGIFVYCFEGEKFAPQQVETALSLIHRADKNSLYELIINPVGSRLATMMVNSDNCTACIVSLKRI